MPRKTVTLSALAVGCLIALSPPASSASSRWEWEQVSRVVAIGDLHGQYDAAVELLVGTGLVDSAVDWSGGRGHLVLCGDLVDRGPRDRSVLDLARKIQRQAKAAGGRVHVLLGNHEVMNLTRDLRYVTRESFAEYAADETARARRRGLSRYRLAVTERGTAPGELQTAFDEAFPPGYFAHLEALAPEGEYGAWLLEQPTVVKINGVLFVHGGLTAEVAALGLDEINRRMRAEIVSFVEAARTLARRAPWPADFGSVVTTAIELAGSSGRRAPTDPLLAAARAVLEARRGLPFSPSGPVWYRGSSIEDEKLELGNVLRVLELLEAKAQVVGHTPTRTQRISSRFAGRLLRADVGMGYGLPALALILEEGQFLVFDPEGEALPRPLVEPPQGEGWPQGEEELSDEVLERFLTSAPVTASRDVTVDGVPFRVVELEGDGLHLRAAFGTGRESPKQAAEAGRRARRRFQHQAAAYRLDRRLGLEMVPVTVPRTVAGERGIVQIWMQSAVALPSIELFGGVSYLAGLEPQVARARAFSALIGNQERMDTGKMLLPVSRRVVIADNGIAFPVDADAAHYLPEGCGPIGPAFLTSLRSLRREHLEADLAGLLTAPQIGAVLERRDALLALCATPVPDWSIEKVLAR